MKDFFDEEYEKKQQEERAAQEDLQGKMQEWYSSGTPANANTSAAQTTGRSPWYVVLICVALILAIVLGWVLCAIFGGTRSQEEALLSTVMSYLENEYYLEITDAQMQQAVAAAGTAMLQSAGDQFCQLMSPQELYDYVMQVDNSTVITDYDGYFGISISRYGFGLYISAVTTDSSCYGILQAGDIILKFTDMKDREGNPVSVNGLGEFSEMVIANYDFNVVDEVFAATYSANMVYLRDGELHNSGVITRGSIGFASADPKSKYRFIEYYFDETHNNVSTPSDSNRQHNTYELRGLDNLPADTGYIHISQFMYYMNDFGNEVTAYKEFYDVMQIFRELGLKRLVLDLKGNPGGRVDVVCNIASMLITDAKLSDAKKNTVKGKDGILVTSLVPRNAKKTETTYVNPCYDRYFPAPTDKCDIVIWTDGGSASASELLTGALTDYQTAFQIGTRTYGKGIAQRIIALESYRGAITPVEGDDTREYYWAIYYTFAKYNSPLGTNIHGNGYTPSQGYDNISDYGAKDTPNTLWAATYRYWNLSVQD